MRLLEISGSGQEMGEAHGRAVGKLIAQIADDNRASLQLLAQRRADRNLDKALLDRRIRDLIPFIAETSPELWAETQGIAAGANVALNDVVALNAFLDLHDLTFPSIEASLAAPGCCTSVALRSDDTDTAFIGQNYDVRDLFGEGPLVMDLRPSDGPRALVASFAGMVGCAGINEHGVAVMINNLTPLDAGLGLTHAYVVRSILAAENISSAINAVVGVPRSSGFNYLLGDSNGEIIGLETSATGVATYLPNTSGVTCHSNHYLDPSLIPGEVQDVRNGDTIARHARASHLLPRAATSQDPLGQCMSILADHANFPTSICRHVPAGAAAEDPHWRLTQGRTVFSVFADMKRKSLWYCEGNPCTGRYEELTFS
jgi:isopenicillin-N N-acyltransferase like protein